MKPKTQSCIQVVTFSIAAFSTFFMACAPMFADAIDVPKIANEMASWPAQTLLACIALVSMYFSFTTWKLYCAQNEKHTNAVNSLCAELRRRPCVLGKIENTVGGDLEIRP